MKLKSFKFKKIILIFTVFLIPVIFAFQNCSKVELKSLTEDSLVNLKIGDGQFCLPTNYTMETVFVTNINVRGMQGGLRSDTDGDGLSDAEEVLLGSDPYNRRSGGFVLDSICKDVDFGPQCSNFNMACDMTENALGMNECDLMALQISKSVSLGAGIDSDKDGIPDFVELTINSFPNLNDALSDLDLDQINTIAEAERGTSVHENNDLISKNNQVQIAKTRIESPDCDGELWEVKVNNLPGIMTDQFVDAATNSHRTFGDRFSHATDENVIQIFFKLKPISGTTLKAKTATYYQKIKIDVENKFKRINMNFDLNDYFSGEVEQ